MTTDVKNTVFEIVEAPDKDSYYGHILDKFRGDMYDLYMIAVVEYEEKHENKNVFKETGQIRHIDPVCIKSIVSRSTDIIKSKDVQ